MRKIILFFSFTLAILLFSIPSFAQEENIIYSIGKYENSKIIVRNEDSQIKLSDFSLYHITEYYDYEFYLFDVLENGNSGIQEIKCVTKNANYDYKIKYQADNDLNNYNSLEIIIEKDKTLYITYIPLRKEDFKFITEPAISINFYEQSDLVERLKQSLSYEFLFKSHIPTQKENKVLNTQSLTQDFQNSNIYCNRNNTVRYGACAEETSTNSCINQLKKDNNFYKGQIFNRKQFTDSPLVYAIPKKYFMTRGIYSYIGPEYGFYINTYQDTGNDNMSNFLIFDIQEKKKAYNQNGEILVKPILTGYTKYKRDTQIVTFEIDSSNLALSNINLAVNLYNQTEKNIGDEGYIPEQDYGYAIKEFGIEARASNISENYDYAFLIAKLSTIALKYIPKVGPFIHFAVNSCIELIENYYNQDKCVQYHNLIKMNNSIYSSSFSLNSADSVYSMIHEYGNLVKGINANLQIQEGELDEYGENTIFYKVSKNDYFKLIYNCFQHSADVCWDTSILTKLSLNIIEVNGNGVELKDSVTGSWVNSFNENPTIKETTMYLDTVYAVEFGIKSHQLLSFSPSNSGSYCFETYNTESDILMELYEDGRYVEKSDDEGSYLNFSNSKRCAKITWDLKYGKKYTVKIFGYNDSGGYCNIRVKKMAPDLKEYENNTFNCITNNYSSESYWQEFTPHKTGYYSFSVNSSDCAVNLTLYDHNHNRIANDYYASYSGRVILYVYLNANQKYYVQSKIHGYMGRNYTFGVVALSGKSILKPSEFCSEQFNLDTGYPNTLYTIVVSDTKNYNLGLHFVQGYNYLYLELYNENFEKIYSGSFLGKEYMPINTALTKNKCYYLYVSQIPGVTDSFTTLTQANIFLQGV